MELFRCTADCKEEAFVHCLQENKSYCSMHFKKAHMKHPFKAIPKEELAKRKQLQAILLNDLKKVSSDGLTQALATKVQESVTSAAQDFKTAFEEWISVYRDQLLNVRKALEDRQAETWPSAVERVMQRLSEDYSGPLLDYGLTIEPLRVRFDPLPLQGVPAKHALTYEETKEENPLLKFRLLASNIPAYFQANSDYLSPELRKAWAGQNFHQLVVKGLNTDSDLVGIALLLAHSRQTRALVITRCGYSPRTAEVLKEAFVRTASELKTVDMSGSELGDEGFRVVMEGILGLRALTLLAVRNTGLTDASIPLFLKLKGVKLDAGGNLFSIPGKSTLLTHNPEHKL